MVNKKPENKCDKVLENSQISDMRHKKADSFGKLSAFFICFLFTGL